MRRFRVAIKCAKCNGHLTNKTYLALEKRKEPDRYCANCLAEMGGTSSSGEKRVEDVLLAFEDLAEEAVESQIMEFYAGMGIEELNALAKEAGIRSFWFMNKDTLVEKLTELAIEKLVEEEGGTSSSGTGSSGGEEDPSGEQGEGAA